MTKRADLEAIGIKALHAYTGPGGGKYGAEAIVSAFAAMLSATPAASGTRRRKPADGPTLPFSPQALHQEMVARVSDKVSMELVAGSLYGRLGANLKSIPGLEADDLDRLVSWIEAGAFDGYPHQMTFQTVVVKIDKYLSLAREWDKRGRQPITRGSSVVGSESAAQFNWGSFK